MYIKSQFEIKPENAYRETSTSPCQLTQPEIWLIRPLFFCPCYWFFAINLVEIWKCFDVFPCKLLEFSNLIEPNKKQNNHKWFENVLSLHSIMQAVVLLHSIDDWVLCVSVCWFVDYRFDNEFTIAHMIDNNLTYALALQTNGSYTNAYERQKWPYWRCVLPDYRRNVFAADTDGTRVQQRGK